MCPPKGAWQGLFVLYQKGIYMERTTFELKYCERCGALGLRRSQSSESYCEPCAQVLTNYLTPSVRGRRSQAGTPGSGGQRLAEVKGPGAGRRQ